MGSRYEQSQVRLIGTDALRQRKGRPRTEIESEKQEIIRQPARVPRRSESQEIKANFGLLVQMTGGAFLRTIRRGSISSHVTEMMDETKR
jgi:hypothetical protein